MDDQLDLLATQQRTAVPACGVTIASVSVRPEWRPLAYTSPLAPAAEPLEVSEQRQLELGNARLATVLRRRLLSGFARLAAQDPTYQPPLTPEFLKLLKDSEDRGLGAPVQRMDSRQVRVTRLDVGRMSLEAMEEVLAQVEDATVVDSSADTISAVDEVDERLGPLIADMREQESDLDPNDGSLL